MRLFNVALIAIIGVTLSQLALASASEYDNVKLPCAVLKNGKVLKQQTCLASGFEHGNVYGGGYGWSFNIKGYGNIILDSGTVFKTDANDELIVDEHGETVEDKSWMTLNDEPASIRVRMSKTFKVPTKVQESQYYEDKLNTQLYTCWYFNHKTQMKFDEVCYIDDR